jgi:hypothetical protein
MQIQKIIYLELHINLHPSKTSIGCIVEISNTNFFSIMQISGYNLSPSQTLQNIPWLSSAAPK